MDVLMAFQNGFKNMVASMGTALTESQVRALRRLTKSFVLAMDADAAGRQASLRGLEVVKQHYGVEHRQSPEIKETYSHIWLKRYVDANIKVITMPEGLDPDDVIRADPKHWARLMEEALPLMDYYFREAAAGRDLDSAAGKSEIVRELLPLIGEIGDGIERAFYLQKLARLVRIDERVLAAEMARSKSRGGPGVAAEDDRSSPIVEAASSLENYCLGLLLGAPELVPEVQDLTADDFRAAESRSVFLALMDSLKQEKAFDLEEFRLGLDPVLCEYVDVVLQSHVGAPVLPQDQLAGEVRQSVSRLRERRDRMELLELESLLSDDQETGDEGLGLWQQVDELRRRIGERQQRSQEGGERAPGG
jgi:DNA primase